MLLIGFVGAAPVTTYASLPLLLNFGTVSAAEVFTSGARLTIRVTRARFTIRL